MREVREVREVRGTAEACRRLVFEIIFLIFMGI